MEITICALMVALGARAFAYEDDSGTRHIFGFVDIAIKPEQDRRLAGDIVEVSSGGPELRDHRSGLVR
jgi:hypothetical protein